MNERQSKAKKKRKNSLFPPTICAIFPTISSFNCISSIYIYYLESMNSWRIDISYVMFRMKGNYLTSDHIN